MNYLSKQQTNNMKKNKMVSVFSKISRKAEETASVLIQILLWVAVLTILTIGIIYLYKNYLI
jgi:hypothetical protein